MVFKFDVGDEVRMGTLRAGGLCPSGYYRGRPGTIVRRLESGPEPGYIIALAHIGTSPRAFFEDEFGSWTGDRPLWARPPDRAAASPAAADPTPAEWEKAMRRRRDRIFSGGR